MRTSTSQGLSNPPSHCPASHAVPCKNEESTKVLQNPMKSEWQDLVLPTSLCCGKTHST